MSDIDVTVSESDTISVTIEDAQPISVTLEGGGGTGGTSDHGELTGLSDDDHTQYILEDGTRDFGAKVSYSSHPTFTTDTEIVDKKYVDDNSISDLTGFTTDDLTEGTTNTYGKTQILRYKNQMSAEFDTSGPIVDEILDSVTLPTLSAGDIVIIEVQNGEKYEGTGTEDLEEWYLEVDSGTLGSEKSLSSSALHIFFLQTSEDPFGSGELNITTGYDYYSLSTPGLYYDTRYEADINTDVDISDLSGETLALKISGSCAISGTTKYMLSWRVKIIKFGDSA